MPDTLLTKDTLVVETVRSAAALTTSYVAATTVNIQGVNEVVLDLIFTKGSSTGFRLKVETSLQDTPVWCQDQELTQSGGVSSYVDREIEFAVSASTAAKAIKIPLNSKWLRISAKALTSGTSTSLAITSGKANIG